jgi:hypothetical protein
MEGCSAARTAHAECLETCWPLPGRAPDRLPPNSSTPTWQRPAFLADGDKLAVSLRKTFAQSDSSPNTQLQQARTRFGIVGYWANPTFLFVPESEHGVHVSLKAYTFLLAVFASIRRRGATCGETRSRITYVNAAQIITASRILITRSAQLL